MSKAYKCDKCGEYHDGHSDIQVGLDKKSEIIFRHTLGVKFIPHSDEAQIYLKDLCNKCAKSFCAWFRKK